MKPAPFPLLSKEQVRELKEEEGKLAPIKKEVEKWKTNQIKLIHALRNKYPDNYLLTEPIWIEPIKELVWIGIFKCKICERPISHHQFAWSGLCGSCDIGNQSPKWKIEMPESVKDKIMKSVALDKALKENEKLKKKLKEAG